MITSKDNEKLKLARKLGERGVREREGLFVAEGEDLLDAALAAGWEPAEVLVRAGSGISGTEVDAALLGAASALGSGTRVISIWPLPDPDPIAGSCVLLDGVSDPGNVGTIVRSAAALCGATVALGAAAADPWSPRAVRASMGAAFGHPPQRVAVAATPAPRLGIVAHGGGELDATLAATAPATICLGSEREGLSAEVAAACEASATIPLVGSAESLNVAAAAAIACQRLSSSAPPGASATGE